jgi:hypothetical protein
LPASMVQLTSAPAGRLSVTLSPVAAVTLLLVTVTVKPICEPALTLAASAVLVMLTLGGGVGLGVCVGVGVNVAEGVGVGVNVAVGVGVKVAVGVGVNVAEGVGVNVAVDVGVGVDVAVGVGVGEGAMTVTEAEAEQLTQPPSALKWAVLLYVPVLLVVVPLTTCTVVLLLPGSVLKL